jgi:NhaP-type Na+/H+ and K+/H+ antiporter
MDKIINDITQMIGSYVPNLLGAIAILVIGWIVALIIARVVKSLLKKIDLDNKVAKKLSAEEGSRLYS